MGLSFEWDEQKSRENLRRHGVSFEESSTIFGDPLSLTIEEDRLITIGLSNAGTTLVVVHTERGDNIRVISARIASPRERRMYVEGTGK